MSKLYPSSKRPFLITSLLAVLVLLVGAAQNSAQTLLDPQVSIQAQASLVLPVQTAEYQAQAAREKLEGQILSVLSNYKTGMDEAQQREVARTIIDEANKFEFDPWLVVGLIRVESAFFNNAVSYVGAAGLMQIRPFVGKAVAHDIDLQWDGEQTLYEPAQNIRIGTAYLARLKKRFHGKVDRALQAYNIGPTRVSRWLQQDREIPTVYSDKVLGFHAEFSTLAKSADRDLQAQVKATERRLARERAARLTASIL